MKTLFQITLIFCFTVHFLPTQAQVNLNIDRNTMTEELLNRFTSSITAELEALVKTAEGKVLDAAYVREMLEPYKEYGINPNDGEYYKKLNAIYTSIKTDPNYDPQAELTGKIRTMLETRLTNYAKSFIDKESIEIYNQLSAVFAETNKKVTGILEAVERMYELPPDDPEIDTKWANELRKLGITGQFTEMIGDFENMFGQAQARYAKPIEMVTMIQTGLSSKDPTNKIKILFDFGEKFGEDLPVVGTIVSSLFKLGKEVLAAAERAGGMLERNLGQGCISSEGEYVSGAGMKQKFYQKFPHVNRACPLSQSRTAGVYQYIYYNTSAANELLFYANGNWLGSQQEIRGGTHAGEGDIRAIRNFLNAHGETSKAGDLAFLHGAYTKSPGFLDYQKKLKEKFGLIRVLSNRTYSALSHCDDQRIEHFMMDKIEMNWMSKLMKDGSTFDFGTIKVFTQSAIEEMVDQMLINRYLKRNMDNLDHLDRIIENLKDNIPVVVSGTVVSETSDKPIANVKITPDIPLLFDGASCIKDETNEYGRYALLLNVPGAYSGQLGFTASHAGVSQTKELTVNISEAKSYEVNFYLPTAETEISRLSISPAEAILEVGESVTFSVIAEYPDGRLEDVTSLVLTSNIFSAETPGQFTVSGTYSGQEVSALITVNNPDEIPPGGDEEPCDPLTQQWNETLEKCDCLPPLLENSKGECVDPDELETEMDDDENMCEQHHNELILVLEAASQLNEAYIEHYRVFLLNNDQFYKEVNDRAADPCNNLMVGYTYYNALQAADKMSVIESELVSLLIDVSYITAVCSELDDMLQQGGFGSDVTQWVEFYDVSSDIALMSDRLVEFGCNTADVEQNGEGVAPGQKDPIFVGAGGTSTEIAGDGRDNDGDGLQDEMPVSGLPGFNITIALYDSGSAKDDVFNLSVQGMGSLGLTPAGGLRTYGLNLPPGTYRAEVLVVSAPDDIGTFTITILQNDIPIGTLTGEPGEGSVSSIIFDVTE